MPSLLRAGGEHRARRPRGLARGQVGRSRGPNGKAKVVANGRVSGRGLHVIPGVPGQWRITGEGTLTVSAVAADSATVNGEAVHGTAEVPSGSTLGVPGGRVGLAGGAGGFYGVVVMDHEALARSGLSGSMPTPTTRTGSSKASTARLPRTAGSKWVA